ncbi:MAG: hypothetical protein HYT73_04185 [Candidatus Aenigmarchaeota archaeon]|nr:hypothetical protein [Candidatus Aenigmarchaeota archaeon]
MLEPPSATEFIVDRFTPWYRAGLAKYHWLYAQSPRDALRYALQYPALLGGLGVPDVAALLAYAVQFEKDDTSYQLESALRDELRDNTRRDLKRYSDSLLRILQVEGVASDGDNGR